MNLEDAFGISVELDASVKSVGELVTLIENNL